MSDIAWFGTDGMRGAFGTPPLDRRTVEALGFELGATVRASGPAGERPVIVAGDTRDSLPALAAWLARGLADAGVASRFAGVLPTPAVARLVLDAGAPLGLAISASHNPWPDNGIKLVGADGFKWPAAAEAELERRLRARLERGWREQDTATPEVEPGLRERYLSLVATTLGAGSLRGFRVVLDAANGAAVTVCAELFAELGATVEVLHAAPDGVNINRDCGSLHPEALAARVRACGADAGFAFDGDADRAILVDGGGRVHDGDAMLFLWATALARRAALPGSRIVATSMSNLGLERALAAHGIGVERCDVGDRAVVETLRRLGLALGGEQSGHLVDLRDSTTGDGLLTAARIAAIAVGAGRPLAELLQGFRRYPQLLRNVRVTRKPPLAGLPAVLAAQRGVESRLGDDGRLVLRYSGTEPLARIMIEGPDAATIGGMADEIEAALRAEIGA